MIYYNMQKTIERIQRLQKDNPETELISENELLLAIMPKINRIDDVINTIEKRADRREDTSYTDVEKLTIMSRQQLYRWEEDGIINWSNKSMLGNEVNLTYLKETLIKIKKTKELTLKKIHEEKQLLKKIHEEKRLIAERMAMRKAEEEEWRRQCQEYANSKKNSGIIKS